MNAISNPNDLLPPIAYSLRRTGRKALRFQGWQLVEAIGASTGRHVWHDLNIYRTVADNIVVELIVQSDLPEQSEITRVTTFPDLPSAAAWLESYRAADDVPIPEGLAATDAALPWSVLQAVQLRQRIEKLELEYRALLSEVFQALDLTDPADGPEISAPAPAMA